MDAIPSANITLTTNQRGFTRPVEKGGGSNCDVGAYEVQASETTPTAITLADFRASPAAGGVLTLFDAEWGLWVLLGSFSASIRTLELSML